MEDQNNNAAKQESVLIARRESQAFEDALGSFIDDAVSLEVTGARNKQEVGQVSQAMDWFREAIEYNLPHGKRNRGLSVVVTHKILAEHLGLEPDLRRARILGWCIEMLQTHYLILDDIMDESVMRRGQKCWHLKPSVGSVAINDSCYMQASIFHILRKHFIDQPTMLADLTSLLYDTMLRTIAGQCLDLKSSLGDGERPDWNKFTPERYDTIVDHKTAFYSFSAPVRFGMILCGVAEPEVHQAADLILRKMGHLFQVQDDYLDCFGDPQVTGKIGTDIEEGKCCWPIVTALSMADSTSRRILEDNYATREPDNVSKVKQVYELLEIRSHYAQFERECVAELERDIAQFEAIYKLPGEIFGFLLRKICGRQK